MLRRASSLGSGGGGWRWDDAVGACTESLGSETGDVGGDAEIDHQLGHHTEDEQEEAAVAAPSPEKRPRPRLPPPMPRAAEGAFSMRAERRGGRLILTEVRVEQRRQEVFRAERAGGRLRLQFAAADRDVASSSSRSTDGGELCQMAVGARRTRVEIGAVMMGT
ncbi:hypothetical protein PR202_ga22605 [Eleusine coracana subsp. coracana]|uniref:FAF domain-containing protein n=1 Tax=Eleusine coracana subsp. coracana TaxID=191504 RepID=A0AAV5D344_ELECO|nr:hypothetical protein PR202_ga22605 [Eleusine coracana subsp. coracana]